ncbi:MAG TPA: TonB-dependent receptor [Vicinamibacterales bacterium]
MRFVRVLSVVAAVLLAAAPAFAQQTGSITGKVVDNSGGVLPGVTVTATSSVLPTPRVTTTGPNGDYRLPALAPGNYTLTFELQGMQTVTRQAVVQLGVENSVDATLGIGGVTETVEVTAAVSLVDRTAATIKSAVSNEQIMALPVGQEYRDLIKLIPGVQYTEDAIRGPSAGGSGQDNVYQFDGANVTLPLFGTLASEPASHDIAQVTTIKGAARAFNFDRSGGFTIDSVSKSGTNRFSGELSYQLMDSSMVGELDTGSASRFEQDRTWFTANLGGPIIPEKLFFYGSYYRPESSRANQANAYGDLPNFQRTRNEGFGKLTFTPVSSVLLNASYRDTKRVDENSTFGTFTMPTTGASDESRQKIWTAEGSWIVNSRSHVTFMYSHFGWETSSVPDIVAPFQPTRAPGTQLDINNLDRMGLVSLPGTVAGDADFNAFIQPLIDRYGYVENGQRLGGSTIGIASQFNDQDFFRDSVQFAYNINFGGAVQHDLHVGYQWYTDSEDLLRGSNGWGSISIPGGRTAPPAGSTQRAFYTARIQQQSLGAAANINSEYESQSFEINDTIRWNNWTFNAGVLVSNDKLYGQGLRNDDSTLSGFTLAPGVQYLMYEIPFSKMIQPRLGATWAYNGSDTIYASFARYNPAASSLPRAASWDRNNLGLFVDVHFDQNGVLFASEEVGSSSGKLFQDDLDPRTINEVLVGTSKQLTPEWSARLYGRYRHGYNFWEDTNNNARLIFDAPPEIEAKGLYIPNLDDQRRQIGNGSLSGSSYVIAELDNAYTDYTEVTLESEWRGRRAFVRGSYTWSRYYGTLDQDNSTVGNDANIFIGSSNIGDGAGRQLWDMKEGRLRGDRPHMLKIYGYHEVPWNATAGIYFVAQSGQPWERWSFEPYSHLTSNTSDTIRYAEPAGSNRSDMHYQLDLNYTQNIPVSGRATLQFVADLFNVFDNQTGYDIEPRVHSAGFGEPRSFYDPRRIQIAARIRF